MVQGNRRAREDFVLHVRLGCSSFPSFALMASIGYGLRFLIRMAKAIPVDVSRQVHRMVGTSSCMLCVACMLPSEIMVEVRHNAHAVEFCFARSHPSAQGIEKLTGSTNFGRRLDPTSVAPARKDLCHKRSRQSCRLLPQGLHSRLQSWFNRHELRFKVMEREKRRNAA